MKTLSKRSVLLLTALIAAGNLAPVYAADHPGTDQPVRQAQIATQQQAKDCGRFTAEADKVAQNLVQRITKLAQERAARDQKIAADRAKVDAELTANRAKWDENRKQQFAALEARATTDAQKQAVKEFEASVTAAITARRTANDAARATFRAGVEQAIANRKSQIDSATTTFGTAVASAFSQAVTSCNNGASAQTVRQTLVASLKTARTNLQTAVKTADKVGTNVSSLAKTRNQAFQANNAAFKQAVEAARSKLKTALGS